MDGFDSLYAVLKVYTYGMRRRYPGGIVFFMGRFKFPAISIQVFNPTPLGVYGKSLVPC